MTQDDAMRILRKRGEFLAARVAAAKLKGKELTYDMAECDAIRWVLAQYEPDQPLTPPDPAGTPPSRE